MYMYRVSQKNYTLLYTLDFKGFGSLSLLQTKIIMTFSLLHKRESTISVCLQRNATQFVPTTTQKWTSNLAYNRPL